MFYIREICQFHSYILQGVEYLLGQFCSAVLLVYHHSLLATSRFLPWRGQNEKQRKHCIDTAQKQPKHQCVVNITVASHLNQRIIWIAMEKTDSIPVKTSMLYLWTMFGKKFKRSWIIVAYYICGGGGGKEKKELSIELLRTRDISPDPQKPRYQNQPLLKTQMLLFMYPKKDSMIKGTGVLLKYLDSYCLHEYENFT